MSFVYACKGLLFAFRTQVNFRIHIVALVLVNAAGLFFHIRMYEWLAVWICIALVLAAELLNTALEILTDKLWTEKHRDAGHIKDTGAAAVLVCALVSLVVSGIIFIPYLQAFFR